MKNIMPGIVAIFKLHPDKSLNISELYLVGGISTVMVSPSF
jgi:hypothetical protein